MMLKPQVTRAIEKAPLRLEETRVWRFYRGGSQIGRWHGRDMEADGDFPEDWVGSTTNAFNPGRTEVDSGLSRLILPSGERPTLLSLIQQMPEFMLGEQARTTGSAAPGAGVLVKLLDPCERLPVHAHPTDDFAYRHLGSCFGKAEAWIVLAVRPPHVTGSVYVGLRERVSRAEYMHWIETQDRQHLLSSLQEIEVKPGDAVFVPPGVPHAIGPGLMIAEVQQPTDFSVVCEYNSYSIAPEDCHLGLGWSVALEMLDLQPMTQAEQRARCGPLDSERVQLPPEADRYFQVAELRSGDKIAGDGLHIVMCTEGRLSLVGQWGRCEARRGDHFVIPAGAGQCKLDGEGTLLSFRGTARASNYTAT